MESNEYLSNKAIETLKNEETSNKITQSLRTYREGSGLTSTEISDRITGNIIKEVKNKYPNSESGNILIGISLLIQLGGTSPRQPDNKSIDIENGAVDLKTIRNVCKKEKTTVRQYARGISNVIGKILAALGDDAPDGNLAKYMRSEVPNLTKEEAIWASDFQTFNQDCPEIVRQWLVEDYRRKFRKS